ncbi:hypothetical protein EVA_05473 [gut metagenome]|uniref:Uncharacterized protein n=1 Tax=gut metagenome TaxID=749906 RepID=J9GGB6_9ZZZZ
MHRLFRQQNKRDVQSERNATRHRCGNRLIQCRSPCLEDTHLRIERERLNTLNVGAFALEPLQPHRSLGINRESQCRTVVKEERSYLNLTSPFTLPSILKLPIIGSSLLMRIARLI